METSNQAVLSRKQAAVALSVAVRILRGWQATAQQTCRILRVSPATYYSASKDRAAARRLDLDQQQRVSLVLNIHASLRTVFSNPANVSGFPLLKNDNPFFDGRSPLDIMAQGDLISLYETFKRIEQMERIGETYVSGY